MRGLCTRPAPTVTPLPTASGRIAAHIAPSLAGSGACPGYVLALQNAGPLESIPSPAPDLFPWRVFVGRQALLRPWAAYGPPERSDLRFRAARPVPSRLRRALFR